MFLFQLDFLHAIFYPSITLRMLLLNCAYTTHSFYSNHAANDVLIVIRNCFLLEYSCPGLSKRVHFSNSLFVHRNFLTGLRYSSCF